MGALLLSVVILFAQSPESLDAQLRANVHPFTIVDGRLKGDGAQLIESATAGVQFVALGEEHNRRAMHRFAGALYAYLAHERGFHHLVLEEDPYLGTLLSKNPDGVTDLARRYPNAFHMYTEEELRFLSDAAKLGTIWGVNQMFGAMHVFDRLVALAPNDDARRIAQALLDQSRAYEGERFAKNVHYLEAIARPDDFARLRAAFHPAHGSEAAFLIDQLELSNRLFAPYATKPAPPLSAFLESGAARERNMKLLFADDVRRAQAAGEAEPKAMAMLGQLHLYRGLSQRTGVYTFGNFLSELATFDGSRSLQIYGTINADFEMKSPRAPLARVALDAMGSADGVVIDLRPLFAFTQHETTLDPALRDLIRSFDLFVFMRDGAQGTTEHLRTPNFHWYPN